MEESMVREFSSKWVDSILKVIVLCIVMYCNCTATLLKVVLPHRCFSPFLSCTNDTKSRNASHIINLFSLLLTHVRVYSEAAIGEKKAAKKASQNSQENTCVGVFF